MIKTSSGTVYYTQQEVSNKVNEIMEDGYKITNAIYEEACERDWCDMYDEWAENVNKTLKHFEIPLARKEYEVIYSITRTQTARVTVKTTAVSEDEAKEDTDDSYDESDLADMVQEHQWDTEDITIDGTEVELA
jgi:hypothetical protein